MKRALPLLLCLPLAGCGGGHFAAWRDYPRVAECYAAFLSLSKYAEDPALGIDADRRLAQDRVTMAGINRMTIYTLKAEEAAGSQSKFLRLVIAWRRRPEFNIAAAVTSRDKADIYRRVQDEAGRCHKTLDSWGAAPATPVIEVPPILKQAS